MRLLVTAPNGRLEGVGPASIVEVHTVVARIVVGHAQRQPLRLRLLPRLLARQRWRASLSRSATLRIRREREVAAVAAAACKPPVSCLLASRRRLPLRRSRNAQRRLLGGCEHAQVHRLASTPHPRQPGLKTAGLGEVHAEEARDAAAGGAFQVPKVLQGRSWPILGHEQCQPLRLRLLQNLRGC